MHPMTEANLHNTYSRMSMAHVRYLIYADQAEKEVFRQVAKRNGRGQA